MDICRFTQGHKLWSSAKRLEIPEGFIGRLLFGENIKSLEDLPQLPKDFKGTVSFGTRSAANFKVPNGFSGVIGLHKLKNFEGLIIPKDFSGTLQVYAYSNVIEGIKISDNFSGTLEIKSSTDALNLVIPSDFTGLLKLNSVWDGRKLNLPSNFSGTVYIPKLVRKTLLKIPDGYVYDPPYLRHKDKPQPKVHQQ